MIRLAANISLLFPELEPPDRVRAAAECGFRGVEIQFPYAMGVERVAAAARSAGVEVVLFNAPPGEPAAGELGLAGLPGERRRFEQGIELALGAADSLGCPRLHVMSGRRNPALGEAEQRAALVDALGWAAARAAGRGVTVMVEPLNIRLAPDYLLTTLEDALALVRAVGAPNLQVQFDLFHLQIMGGDILTRFEAALPDVGHVQVAAVPSRSEPDEGELNLAVVLGGIDRLGYPGWVGCEYVPRGDTAAGLGWAAPYGVRPPVPERA